MTIADKTASYSPSHIFHLQKALADIGSKTYGNVSDAQVGEVVLNALAQIPKEVINWWREQVSPNSDVVSYVGQIRRSLQVALSAKEKNIDPTNFSHVAVGAFASIQPEAREWLIKCLSGADTILGADDATRLAPLSFKAIMKSVKSFMLLTDVVSAPGKKAEEVNGVCQLAFAALNKEVRVWLAETVAGVDRLLDPKTETPEVLKVSVVQAVDRIKQPTALNKFSLYDWAPEVLGKIEEIANTDHALVTLLAGFMQAHTKGATSAASLSALEARKLDVADFLAGKIAYRRNDTLYLTLPAARILVAAKVPDLLEAEKNLLTTYRSRVLGKSGGKVKLALTQDVKAFLGATTSGGKSKGRLIKDSALYADEPEFGKLLEEKFYDYAQLTRAVAREKLRRENIAETPQSLRRAIQTAKGDIYYTLDHVYAVRKNGQARLTAVMERVLAVSGIEDTKAIRKRLEGLLRAKWRRKTENSETDGPDANASPALAEAEALIAKSEKVGQVAARVQDLSAPRLEAVILGQDVFGPPRAPLPKLPPGRYLTPASVSRVKGFSTYEVIAKEAPEFVAHLDEKFGIATVLGNALHIFQKERAERGNAKAPLLSSAKAFVSVFLRGHYVDRASGNLTQHAADILAVAAPPNPKAVEDQLLRAFKVRMGVKIAPDLSRSHGFANGAIHLTHSKGELVHLTDIDKAAQEAGSKSETAKEATTSLFDLVAEVLSAPPSKGKRMDGPLDIQRTSSGIVDPEKRSGIMPAQSLQDNGNNRSIELPQGGEEHFVEIDGAASDAVLGPELEVASLADDALREFVAAPPLDEAPSMSAAVGDAAPEAPSDFAEARHEITALGESDNASSVPLKSKALAGQSLGSIAEALASSATLSEGNGFAQKETPKSARQKNSSSRRPLDGFPISAQLRPLLDAYSKLLPPLMTFEDLEVRLTTRGRRSLLPAVEKFFSFGTDVAAGGVQIVSIYRGSISLAGLATTLASLADRDALQMFRDLPEVRPFAIRGGAQPHNNGGGAMSRHAGSEMTRTVRGNGGSDPAVKSSGMSPTARLAAAREAIFGASEHEENISPSRIDRTPRASFARLVQEFSINLWAEPTQRIVRFKEFDNALRAHPFIQAMAKERKDKAIQEMEALFIGTIDIFDEHKNLIPAAIDLIDMALIPSRRLTNDIPELRDTFLYTQFLRDHMPSVAQAMRMQKFNTIPGLKNRLGFEITGDEGELILSGLQKPKAKRSEHELKILERTVSAALLRPQNSRRPNQQGSEPNLGTATPG